MITVHVPHPTISRLVLVLIVSPAGSRVVWWWGQRMVWIGLPCEA